MQEVLTEAEARGLDEIKAKMSQTQRAEMAEIIQKEMERRGMVETGNQKSAVRAAGINGGLSSEQVKELYQDVGQAMQQLKVKKLEEKLSKARSGAVSAPKKRSSIDDVRTTANEGFSMPTMFLPKAPNLKSLLFFSVCALAATRAAFSLGLFESTIATAKPVAKEDHQVQVPLQVASTDINEPIQLVNHGDSTRLWSQQEKEILTQLDSRRVELERRKDALDKREQELKNQTQALTERLAELRGLTAKLQELRKEREHKQEGRMAQLANVYGAMEPAEAASLVSRLEDAIALELLERMPEKRMGQILGFMEKGRAVDLTKLLTEKKIVD